MIRTPNCIYLLQTFIYDYYINIYCIFCYVYMLKRVKGLNRVISYGTGVLHVSIHSVCAVAWNLSLCYSILLVFFHC
jgi:hypothetical protein